MNFTNKYDIELQIEKQVGLQSFDKTDIKFKSIILMLF